MPYMLYHFIRRRIKALREEIAVVQQSREKAEKQARGIKKTDNQKKIQIKFFQDKTKVEGERCENLEETIQQHPMASALCSL